MGGAAEGRHLWGTMGLAVTSWMASFFVATNTLADPKLLCPPQPALPPGVILCRPGANVSLPCLQGEPADTPQVHWKIKGKNLSSHHARQVCRGGSLVLTSVDFSDSGLYSCHAGSRVLRSLRLLVEECPETPNVTCSWRSPSKNILCEWRPSRPVSANTTANLWIKTGFMGTDLTQHACRYFPKSQKFTCRVEPPSRDDSVTLQLSMCVANPAGNATSEPTFLRTSHLLKPDPPDNVTVTAVTKSPRKLFVTWRYPGSWGSTFYRLNFQLRYGTEMSEADSQVYCWHGTQNFTINDALQGARHVVQVRAREEFNRGDWSEWSRPITATPWTEPTAKWETVPFVPKSSFSYDSNHTSRPMTPVSPRFMEKPAVEDVVAVPLHTFLLTALSVTVGLALVVGVVLRYRKKWRLLSSGEGKPSPGPAFSLAPVASDPPLSASPLLSSPSSPCSESSVDTPSLPDHGPYDVCNTDYFLLPR